MSSIMDLMTQHLGGGALSQLSNRIGADESRTNTAVSAALPAILGALAHNAKSPDGAASLNRALEKDHDGSLLEQLSGFLSNPERGSGDGILRHALGGRRETVERGISKGTGLDAGSVAKLMTALAPIVMAALGKARRQSNVDANGLSNMLGQERSRLANDMPREMGLLDSLLDSDGDGDFDISDMARHGAGLLGRLTQK